MKKLYMLLSTVVLLILCTACGNSETSGKTSYYNNHPAAKLIEDETVVTRESAISDDVLYSSFSVYGELSSEQLSEVAEYTELGITGKSQKKDDGTGLDLKKCSFVFYKEDTEELIDAFMYHDGERLPASDDDVFLPASAYGAQGEDE